MFNKILKYFKKTKELDEKDFDKWYSEESSSVVKQLNQQIFEINNQIKGQIGLVKESINELKNAELMNKNISKKEIQYMEGNREFFIKAVNRFLDNICFAEEINGLSQPISNFEDNAKDLLKSTQRSVVILNQFFEDEVKNIFSKIKKLEDNYNELKKVIDNEKHKKLNSLKEEMDNLDNNDKRKKQLETKIAEINNNLNNLNNELEVINKKNEELTFSDKYNWYLMRSRTIEEKERYLVSEKDKINHIFSELSRAIKKYQRIDDDPLIELYLSDAAKAFLEDDQLKILPILRKLQNSIDQLEFSEKEELLIIKKINSLFNMGLAILRNQYVQINSELNELRSNSDTSIVEEIEKNKEEIENLRRKMDILQKELKETEESFSLVSKNIGDSKLKEILKESYGILLK